MLTEKQLKEWRARWQWFSPEEVLSPGSLQREVWHKICPHSLDALCLFREQLNRALVCNFAEHRLRGLRTVEENLTLEKAGKESMHICGRAFDLSCATLSVAELAEAAWNSKLWSGIGIYSTWVHVDTRLRFGGGITLWRG